MKRFLYSPWVPLLGLVFAFSCLVAFAQQPRPTSYTLTNSQLFFPTAAGLPSYAEAEDATGSDNEVNCYRFLNLADILVTRGTFWGMEVASGAATDFLGLAIYRDANAGPAGTNLGRGKVAFASDGVASIVVFDPPVHLDAGYWYRVCATQSDKGAFDWMAVAVGTGAQGILDSVVATEGLWATAANSASDGTMPDFTGALSATDEAMPLLRLQSDN